MTRKLSCFFQKKNEWQSFRSLGVTEIQGFPDELLPSWQRGTPRDHEIAHPKEKGRWGPWSLGQWWKRWVLDPGWWWLIIDDGGLWWLITIGRVGTNALEMLWMKKYHKDDQLPSTKKVITPLSFCIAGWLLVYVGNMLYCSHPERINNQ